MMSSKWNRLHVGDEQWGVLYLLTSRGLQGKVSLWSVSNRVSKLNSYLSVTTSTTLVTVGSFPSWEVNSFNFSLVLTVVPFTYFVTSFNHRMRTRDSVLYTWLVIGLGTSGSTDLVDLKTHYSQRDEWRSFGEYYLSQGTLGPDSPCPPCTIDIVKQYLPFRTKKVYYWWNFWKWVLSHSRVAFPPPPGTHYLTCLEYNQIRVWRYLFFSPN